MKIKNIILMMIIAIVIGAGFYSIAKFDLAKKIERAQKITKSILHGVLEGPHKYYPTHAEITEEELKEINVTKIAQEIGEGITAKEKKKIAVIEKKTEEALKITTKKLIEEKKLKHTKAKARKARFLKPEELPQKFRPLKKYLHEPFHMGACELCHVSAGAKPGKLITKNIEELCYKCHKTRYNKKFDHKPVKEGRCIDCHDPHQSNANNLLKADTVNQLCLKCHKPGNKKKIKKTVNMKAAFKHKPAEDNCVKCHEAHTSDFKTLLKDDGKMRLCLDCHSKLEKHVNMKKWIENVKYKHGAVNNSKRKCLECHNPHATNHKGILKKQQVKMCLSCHNKEVKSDEDGGMLMNMAEHLKRNPNWHKPIKDVKKEGGCAACHNPHGSNHFSILRRSYTTEFYDDFEAKKDFICFKCHKIEKIKDKYSEKTDFRDGKVNLHYLHVNNKKGRACRACHDEHASKYPHLIRRYTEFGGIKFPIRYIETKTGGSCQPACHKKYEYDRVKQKNKYSEDVFKK
ncbi:cytochrome c3 family protein [Nitrosophilus alvini]|uniref:cytochrome c3 family protein n=1 Tax=Nitrosophilus alvini TaxID=2714855 RepID=UPI00190C458E|nr:cytochrome c3 family protein [Nitrosophilus alvini]